MLIAGHECGDFGQLCGLAVALVQLLLDHGRWRGQVEEGTVAGDDGLGEVDGLGPGDAGPAAQERAVDEFAEEAAVEDEEAGAVEQFPLAVGEVEVVGGAG
ncbi:hypothetical protein JNUCC64_04730 [Streptomyces sp. JNUCC 64]